MQKISEQLKCNAVDSPAIFVLDSKTMAEMLVESPVAHRVEAECEGVHPGTPLQSKFEGKLAQLKGVSQRRSIAPV